MEVRRLNDVEGERLDGSVFETQVHKKEGVSAAFDGDRTLSVSEILFAPGERTTMHKHTIRQVLYVTEGEGIVASEDERHEVAEGDVISIPPDVDHWHGATPESTFRHLAIVVRDDKHGGTIAVEEPAGRRSA